MLAEREKQNFEIKHLTEIKVLLKVEQVEQRSKLARGEVTN